MYSNLIKNHKSVNTGKHRPDNFISEMIKKSKAGKERVDKGNGWEDRLECPCCRGNQYEPELVKFGIEMVKCLDCSLRYHTKIPVDINDYYNDSDYTKKSPGYWIDGEYDYRKNRFGKERVLLLEELYGNLNGRKLLDVGCGAGWFLEAAKEFSLDCYGLEIADEIKTELEERLKIPIFNQTLDSYHPDFQFDLITSFDVIEHLKNPMEHLFEINRLISNNGILLIFTPNFDSFSIQVLKEKSNNIGPGGHLQLFTKKAIDESLKKAGFEMVYYATRGLDVNDIKSMVKEEIGGEKEYCFSNWGNEIQAIIDEAECGSYMRVAAKKI